jgi:hypothetical protein
LFGHDFLLVNEWVLDKPTAFYGRPHRLARIEQQVMIPNFFSGLLRSYLAQISFKIPRILHRGNERFFRITRSPRR